MNSSVLKGLLWPAIAGNVVWAFFNVAIAEEWSSAVAARLASLVLLAFYLIFAWKRDRDKQNVTVGYAVLDTFFAAAIAALAISKSAPSSAASIAATVALVSAFGISAFGHWRRVWMPNGYARERKVLIGANMIAIGVALFGMRMEFGKHLWMDTGALAVVLVLLASLGILRRFKRSNARATET